MAGGAVSEKDFGAVARPRNSTWRCWHITCSARFATANTRPDTNDYYFFRECTRRWRGTRAELQRKVYSVYPPAAEAGNITGNVLFRVVIAKDGLVESVEYLSGPSVFVESAKSAVQQYRYKPTVVGNMPVEVETIVAVPFMLPQ